MAENGAGARPAWPHAPRRRRLSTWKRSNAGRNRGSSEITYEAESFGLVNQVFPSATFLADVNTYARDLAERVSPRSLRVIKRQVYGAMFQTLEEALDTADDEMRSSLQCEDFKEGVAHFLEKRAPTFTGR